MKPLLRTTTKYVVNGREYASLDAMPEADRKLFEDANRNGIPDAIEESLAKLGVDPATLTRTGAHTEQVLVTTEQRTEWSPQASLDEAPPRPGEIRPHRRGRWTVQIDLGWPIALLVITGIALALWRWFR